LRLIYIIYFWNWKRYTKWLRCE